jgi:hypothetical protein
MQSRKEEQSLQPKVHYLPRGDARFDILDSAKRKGERQDAQGQSAEKSFTPKQRRTAPLNDPTASMSQRIFVNEPVIPSQYPNPVYFPTTYGPAQYSPQSMYAPQPVEYSLQPTETFPFDPRLQYTAHGRDPRLASMAEMYGGDGQQYYDMYPEYGTGEEYYYY